MSVCTSKYKIFCSKHLGLLTFSKRQNFVFLEEGFGNCNKALQMFQQHEKSDVHKEMAAKCCGTNVASQLSAQH